MGLYVDKNRRVYASAFQRREALTPLYQIVVSKLETLPALIREHVLAEYERRAPLQWLGESDTHARDWLIAQTKKLVARKLDVAFDVEETASRAERFAALSRRERTIELIKRFASYAGLPTPQGNKLSTPESLARRCYEPKTWRRIIEKTNTRDAENCLREMGYVERGQNLYCSRYALDWFHGKQRAQVRWLKSHRVSDDKGTQLNLFEVRQRSVSNPAIRRAELMMRMKGFEEIAKELGHVAEFVTLTAPSAFHSMLSSGHANPHFEGYSPRDAQAWLSKMWARSRAEIKRKSLIVYGFRIAEPHHDGTPHWHMVLFCPAHQVDALRFVLRSHWLSEYAHERGSSTHRIEFKTIDPLKGSATGYISKYVAKNIDGFEVGEDYETQNPRGDGSRDDGADAAESAAASAAREENKTDATNTSARVRAWASLHGIRQFQQIGGPRVTLYREHRRCRNGRNGIDVGPIERARVHADAGNWAGYIGALGGIENCRQSAIALWTKTHPFKRNLFGEPRGAQITGIRCGDYRVRTRIQNWQIERDLKFLTLGPVQLLTRVQGQSGNPIAWTNPRETSMYGPGLSTADCKLAVERAVRALGPVTWTH